MNQIISTPAAPAAIGPYSQAIQAGGLLFLSGTMPIDPATGALAEPQIASQAEQVMKNIGAVLQAAGCTFEDVVKTIHPGSDTGSWRQREPCTGHSLRDSSACDHPRQEQDR